MLGLFSPAVQVIPTVTVLLVTVGMLVLAAADIWRHEVEDYATAILLAVAAGGLISEGVSAQQGVSGALSAGIAFLVYLALGIRGVMGGGDVKLSVVPALVLGACNPFLGVWWIAASILIQQAFFVAVTHRVLAAARRSGDEAFTLPHVPAMATAMLVAPMIFSVEL